MERSFSFIKRFAVAAVAFTVATFSAFAQWTDVGADFPVPSSFNNWAHMAQVGSKIYMFGGLVAPIGSTSGNFTNKAWSLDVSQANAQWTEIASMPTMRAAGATAVVNGKIYIIAGLNGNALTTETLEFDPVAGTYTAKQPISTGVIRCGSAAVNGKIFVINGIVNNAYSAAIQVYDVATDSWSSGGNSRSASYFPSITSVGTDIYMVGGVTSAGYTNMAYKGAVGGTGSITWTSIAPYPIGVGIGAAGAMKGNVFVAGGIDADGETSKAYYYNVATKRWDPTYSLPVKTYNVSILPEYQDALYFVSGINSVKTYKLTMDSPTPVLTVNPSSIIFQVAIGSSKDKVLQIENSGIANLTGTVKVSDNTPWLSIDFKDFIIEPGLTTEMTVSINTTGMADGKYTGSIHLTSNDENNPTKEIPVTLSIFKNLIPRRPLLEVFTSSTCGPCRPGNENLDAVLAQINDKDKFTVVKYQQDFPGTGDPYCTTEAVNRRSFYSINSIPRMEIDGGWDNNAASATQFLLNQFADELCFMEVDAQYDVQGKDVKVKVNIKPSDDYPDASALYVAVCEKSTTKNVKSNGETKFGEVMKKMLPDNNGEFLGELKKDETVTREFEYTFAGDYRLPSNGTVASRINHTTEHSVEEFTDLEVVVWVQDLTTKKVHQSAWAVQAPLGVDEEIPVTGANAVLGDPSPNPTGSKSSFAYYIPETGAVKISIVNAVGQTVATVLNNETRTRGKYIESVNTDLLPNGMYTVLLQSNGQKIGKMLSVLR